MISHPKDCKKIPSNDRQNIDNKILKEKKPPTSSKMTPSPSTSRANSCMKNFIDSMDESDKKLGDELLTRVYF